MNVWLADAVQMTMRNTAVAAFAVLALASPALASASVFDETEHLSRTIALEPGGTLRL